MSEGLKKPEAIPGEVRELTETEEKVAEQLRPFFENLPVKHYGNGLPYIEVPGGPDKIQELVFLLDSIGVFVWKEKDVFIVDGKYDLEHLSLLGLIPMELDFTEEMEAFAADAEVPPHFFESKKPIPDIFKKPEVGTHKEFQSILHEPPAGKTPARFYHGNTWYLYAQGKEYKWRGQKLFRKKGRELTEMDYETEYLGLLQKAQKGDREARNEFLKMNIGLCYFVAFNFNEKIPWVNTADLLQEALIGLNRCIDRYKLENNEAKFSTYAIVCMDYLLFRWFRNNIADIRVPVHAYDIRSKMKRTEERIIQTVGNESDPGIGPKVAESIGIPYEKLLRLRRYTDFTKQTFVPIHTETAQKGDTENTAFADPEQDPYYEAVRKYEEETIAEMLATLTPQEAKVIKLRFGIGTNREYTLEEIGVQFDVTRERIRQIEAKALRKLRHPSRANYMRSFLDEEDSDGRLTN